MRGSWVLQLENMMFRKVAAVLALAISASAGAEGFSYTYASLGYGTTDFDVIDADGDGYIADGSYAFNQNFHGFAGVALASLESNAVPGDVDATRLSVGVGYNRGLSDTVDLVAKLSYEELDFDVPGPGGDDSGYGLGVGVRFMASDMFELNGGIKRVDYSDFGDDTAFEIGGLYSFNDDWSIGLAGEFSDDVSLYKLSGRFYFGR